MLWLLFVGFVAVNAAEDFTGHRVLECIPVSEAQLENLYSLKQHVVDIDFWRAPSAVGRPVHVRVPPSRTALSYLLQKSGVNCTVYINDVQQLLDEQDVAIETRQQLQESDADYDYNNYHKLEEIQEWVDDIAAEYSDFVSVVDIGQSYEKRPIKALKIAKPGSGKKSVFIEGGIHAREWISPATVIYMTKMLLEDTETDLLDKLDWYILPVFNVDGYVFTWDSNRMWRKTRRPNSPNICVGTDPNRNWPFKWGEEGASRNECAEDYMGPEPLSEVEVKAVTDFLAKDKFDGFIDVHSYSQLWMYPWGYTRDLPDDVDALDALGKSAVSALEAVHGTKYELGSISRVIYKASGSSADWTYAEADIKYSYAIELRDTGRYGFVLPPDQIQPSAEETYQALKKFGEYIVENN